MIPLWNFENIMNSPFKSEKSNKRICLVNEKPAGGSGFNFENPQFFAEIYFSGDKTWKRDSIFEEERNIL